MRTAGGTSSHTLRNNIAAEPGRTIVSFTGGTDDSNSWTLPVEVSNADFTGTDVAQALQPRQADGSLPRVAFLRLADGSDLIDRGEDVGLPFTGSAPDLGAYEFGEEPPVEPPDGGMPDASTGADSGTAGAAGGSTAGSGGAQAGAAGLQSAGSGGTAGSGGAPRPGGMSAAMPPATGMAGAGATAGTGGSVGEQDAGCGCRVAPSRPAAPAWLLLLGAAWLAVRKRVRARSPYPSGF
jgi:MYXO-CTERM domain-containing protein